MTEGIYQTVVSAPGFSIGVRCDEAEIHTIEYLEPRTEVVPSNALAREAARQLQAYLADPDFVFTLPLRPSGTAFQRRVWEQISAIPSHQTRTYGELANVPAHLVVKSPENLSFEEAAASWMQYVTAWGAGYVSNPA